MHAQTQLINAIFVYYVNNHLVGLFMNIVPI